MCEIINMGANCVWSLKFIT